MCRQIRVFHPSLHLNRVCVANILRVSALIPVRPVSTCVLAITAPWSARVYAVARETHGRVCPLCYLLPVTCWPPRCSACPKCASLLILCPRSQLAPCKGTVDGNPSGELAIAHDAFAVACTIKRHRCATRCSAPRVYYANLGTRHHSDLSAVSVLVSLTIGATTPTADWDASLMTTLWYPADVASSARTGRLQRRRGR